MFKILNGPVDFPKNDRLIPADKRRHGVHNQAYKHLRANTTLEKKLALNYIPDWNSLPAAAIWMRVTSPQGNITTGNLATDLVTSPQPARVILPQLW